VRGETQLKRSFRREDDSAEEYQKKNQNFQVSQDERIASLLVEA
jgi:hypothetical protein